MFDSFIQILEPTFEFIRTQLFFCAGVSIYSKSAHLLAVYVQFRHFGILCLSRWDPVRSGARIIFQGVHPLVVPKRNLAQRLCLAGCSVFLFSSDISGGYLRRVLDRHIESYLSDRHRRDPPDRRGQARSPNAEIISPLRDINQSKLNRL